MTEDQIKEFVIKYLKDNLEIEIDQESYYGTYDEDSSGTNITISLWLGETKISEREFGIDR